MLFDFLLTGRRGAFYRASTDDTIGRFPKDDLVYRAHDTLLLFELLFELL